MDNKFSTKNINYILRKHKNTLVKSKFATPTTRNLSVKYLKLIMEMLLTALAVFTIVFLIVNQIPGENSIITKASQKGGEAARQALREQFGLNDPLIVRYFTSLGNIFNGTFGLSGTTGTNVGPILFERISISIQIGMIAIALSIMIGIPIGVFLARREGFWSEITIALISSIGFAVPSFVIGFIFMLINYSLGLPIIFDYGNIFMYIIPALVISLPIAFAYTRYLRQSMRYQYKQQYVQFARIKGVDENNILWKHTFKTSLYPIITYFPSTVIAAFFGSITIEAVFGIPGSGDMLVSSILSNDHNAIIGLSTIYTLLIVIGFFIREILYTIIDPRTRVN